MYAEFLQATAHYAIEEAGDGRDALVKALTHHPDIIITETRMPGIDGFDLCRLLRRDDETRAIPIVVVTGDAFPADIARARAAGADEVLVKPCLPEKLAAAITRQLQRSLELRDRWSAIGVRASTQVAIAEELIDQSRSVKALRAMLTKTHHRHDTTTPPIQPPALLCPTCDQSLRYVKSHVGGVSAKHPEQWDYFECLSGCGTFQYRQRTRKLRRVL